MAPMARLAHLDPWGRGLYSLRLLDLMGHSARSDLMGQARCSRPLLHLFLQYHQRRRCHLFHRCRQCHPPARTDPRGQSDPLDPALYWQRLRRPCLRSHLYRPPVQKARLGHLDLLDLGQCWRIPPRRFLLFHRCRQCHPPGQKDQKALTVPKGPWVQERCWPLPLHLYLRCRPCHLPGRSVHLAPRVHWVPMDLLPRWRLYLPFRQCRRQNRSVQMVLTGHWVQWDRAQCSRLRRHQCLLFPLSRPYHPRDHLVRWGLTVQLAQELYLLRQRHQFRRFRPYHRLHPSLRFRRQDRWVRTGLMDQKDRSGQSRRWLPWVRYHLRLPCLQFRLCPRPVQMARWDRMARMDPWDQGPYWRHQTGHWDHLGQKGQRRHFHRSPLCHPYPRLAPARCWLVPLVHLDPMDRKDHPDLLGRRVQLRPYRLHRLSRRFLPTVPVVHSALVDRLGLWVREALQMAPDHPSDLSALARPAGAQPHSPPQWRWGPRRERHQDHRPSTEPTQSRPR
jgi:hypothetical protein